MGDLLLWLDDWLGGGGRGWLTLHAAAEAVRPGRVALESRWLPLPFRGYRPGSIERDVLGEHLTRAVDIANLPIMRGLLRAGVRHRAIATIGRLDDYAAAFESMDRPLLVMAGRLDDLAPPASVRPEYERSRSGYKTYRVAEHGHVDMLVGRDAPQSTWPLQTWLRKRCAR
jgi:pimeloyl-ACP methyl ester carboxylesterase